jgi:hypothetical protein
LRHTGGGESRAPELTLDSSPPLASVKFAGLSTLIEEANFVEVVRRSLPMQVAIA